MTHCIACDKNLSDYEATRKIVREDGSVEYPDMCNKCFDSTNIRGFCTIIERDDLAKTEDIEDLDYECN